MSINKRSDLKTESINKNSINIDSMSTYDILQTINNEDIKIPKIVGGSLDKIEVLVDICVKAIKNGKRIFMLAQEHLEGWEFLMLLKCLLLLKYQIIYSPE